MFLGSGRLAFDEVFISCIKDIRGTGDPCWARTSTVGTAPGLMREARLARDERCYSLHDALGNGPAGTRSDLQPAHRLSITLCELDQLRAKPALKSQSKSIGLPKTKPHPRPLVAPPAETGI